MADLKDYLAQGYTIAEPDAPIPQAVDTPSLDSYLQQGYSIAEPQGRFNQSQVDVAGPLLSVLDMLSFGTGDELVAGGLTGADYLFGGGEGDYSQNLANVRGIQKAYSEQSPYISAGLGLAGALKMPVGAAYKYGSKLLPAGTKALPTVARVAGKTGLGAVEGAIGGGAYGFGSGEGGLENRLESGQEGAGTGAKFGALVSAPMSVAGEGLDYLVRSGKAEDIAESFFNRQIGAKPSNFMRSAKKSKEALKTGGETQLTKDLRQVRKEGVFKNVDNIEDGYKNILKKQNILGKRVNNYIIRADKARKKPLQIDDISFKNAEDYINTQPLDDRPLYKKALQDYKNTLKNEWDGSLSKLQEEKVAIGKREFNPNSTLNKASLDKAIRQDLRKTIEVQTDKVLPQSQANTVKRLNQRWGALEEAENIVRKEVARAEGPMTQADMTNLWKTTGGYGVPIALGTGASIYTGDPKYAVMGLGGAVGSKYLMSPKGASKMVSMAENLPQTSERLSQSIGNIAKPVGAISAKMNQGEEQAGPVNYGEFVNEPIPEGVNPFGEFVDTLEPEEQKPEPKKPVKYSRADVKKLVANEPPVIQAMVEVESNYNPRARSKKGAVGIGQLMPNTIKAFNVKDPLNPKENLRGMKALLQEELQRFEEPLLAIAAYNAGSPRVQKAIDRAGTTDFNEVQKYLPKETREYVLKVLGRVKARG